MLSQHTPRHIHIALTREVLEACVYNYTTGERIWPVRPWKTTTRFFVVISAYTGAMLALKFWRWALGMEYAYC